MDAASGDSAFADVLAGNKSYARDFRLAGLEPVAAKGLAVLTCMDSRIEPLEMLGLAPGDAKILRNAGARVTDDVLRTLVLATYLLGVDRAMVVAHTNCRMAAGDEDDVHAAVSEAGGTRHAEPGLPGHRRPGGDAARRRPARALVAVPHGAAGRRLPLRRRHRAAGSDLLRLETRVDRTGRVTYEAVR